MIVYLIETFICIADFSYKNLEVIGMGIYFNPTNESFTQARNSQIFIDKTGLMEVR